MYERFDLQVFRRLRADFPNILQRRLTRKHNGVRAHIIEHVRRGAVDHAQLGADMTPKARRITLSKLQNAQVRNDQGVHADLLQKREIVRKTLQFLLPRKGIAGHIYFCALFMGEHHGPAQCLVVKTDCAGAHAEFPSGEINGVRAVMQRHAKPFKVPCRGQQFNLLRHSPASRQKR